MSEAMPRHAEKPLLYRSRLHLVLACLIVSGISLGIWKVATSPERYLSQARQLSESHPRRAEALAALAIEAAGHDFPAAQLLQAELLLKLNRPEEALGALSLIPSAAVLPPDSLYRLADEALKKQVPVLAIHAIKRASDQPSERAEALTRLVRLYRKLGYTNEAELTSRNLLEIDPNNAEAWLMLGVAYYHQKKLGESENSLRNALRFSEGNREASLLLVEILIDQGMLEEARLQLEALQADSGLLDEETRTQLELKSIKLLQRQGNTEQALQRLVALENIFPEVLGEYLHLRGLILFDLDRNAEAAPCFVELLKRQPWDFQSHNVLAMTYRRLGNTAEANHHQQQADYYREKMGELLETTNLLRQHPDDRAIREKLISLYQLLGREREAAALRMR